MSARTWLTVAQAAEHIAMSERFILDELRRRNLRGTKLARGWRIDAADLDKYMNARANVSRVRAS